jgi:protein TonB
LYKSEWLELVFAKRNKEYGAYYLRQHYANNMVKAMGITFLGVISLAVTFGLIITPKPVELTKTIEVVLNHFVEPPQPLTPKKEVQLKGSAPKKMVNTTRFVTPVITPNPVTTDPLKIDNMKGDVGPVDITAPPTAGTGSTINDGKEANGTGVKIDDDKTYDKGGVEVEPEPYGGVAAWSKFLQKNLRYPAEAVDKGMSGKVWVSFIVEKNGHISSIVVEKGAGYGMDEEALRVLSLAPPWKPGKQNGQPVRVKYTLPLNFMIN